MLHSIPSGDGGDGGRITVRYRAINGNVLLKTCGGLGAEAANNGKGGAGNNNNNNNNNKNKNNNVGNEDRDCADYCWCTGTYQRGNGPEFRKDHRNQQH